MTEEKFFDRKYYLDIIEKRVLGLISGYRQNIAIIGDELVGKTSIIFKFLNKFDDNHIILLYLETRPENMASFVRRFIGVLLYNFLLKSGRNLQEDLEFLISKSEKYIPKTIEKIKGLLLAIEKRKRNDVFGELLELCELIHQETTKSCVVILDEFHGLENLGSKNIYREWSKSLLTQKNTMYIIISSRKFKTKSILAKDLSLLFGNFEVIQIDPFDIHSCTKYLEHKLSTIDLSGRLRDYIVNFTGGYPWYIEVISDALLKLQRPNLTLALEKLIFDSSGVLYQKFSSYLELILDSGQNKDFISILHLIASGQNRIKDISHILKKQKREVLAKINQLLELDVITKNADFLKVNDRIFGFWLKYVHKEKANSLTFDANKQREKFREHIEERIQDFVLSSQKPVAERIGELLKLFEDEFIQFDRKRVRLNHFREIKHLQFGSNNLKDGLLGRSQDAIWIIGIKTEQLSENDIADFAKECKKYRHKQQRKIIVALQDIDSNTRLKAMEEKIWTWDINNLNQILDLYSKPRVIA